MDWDKYKQEKEAEKKENLQRAVDSFDEAVTLACSHGWELIKKSWYHFQLINKKEGWLYNLYPSNQRIYVDPKHGKAPFLRVSSPWTFMDIVRAAISFKV